MESNIDIQELVNEITQPNVVCAIDNKVPKNPEERSLHILFSLMNIVKGCIQKDMYHPYIHIKDVDGNLLFNNRIEINKESINQTAINNPGYCDINLIKEKDSLNIYYCATTPDTLADNNRFYMSYINFTNGKLDKVAYEKAATTILNMVKEGEGIDKNTPIDTSVTVHNYHPNSNFWTIEYFARDVSGSKF